MALPQSPENRRLDRHPNVAHAARDRVLDRMVEDGQVTAEDAAQAKSVTVSRLRQPMPILAPHSADQAMAVVKDADVITLTLDSSLQKVLEALARDRAAALGPNISIAIIAVDNESGDVLARIGSPDYFDDRRAGQVDMALGAMVEEGNALAALALEEAEQGIVVAVENRQRARSRHPSILSI